MSAKSASEKLRGYLRCKARRERNCFVSGGSIKFGLQGTLKLLVRFVDTSVIVSRCSFQPGLSIPERILKGFHYGCEVQIYALDHPVQPSRQINVSDFWSVVYRERVMAGGQGGLRSSSHRVGEYFFERLRLKISPVSIGEVRERWFGDVDVGSSTQFTAVSMLSPRGPTPSKTPTGLRSPGARAE